MPSDILDIFLDMPTRWERLKLSQLSIGVPEKHLKRQYCPGPPHNNVLDGFCMSH